jgi:hypothetical protein
MAVLLKNLVARAPKMEDVVAINELITACDIATYGRADSSLEDLASNWQQSGFNLATDAWVIVTNKGQRVGFAGVWHRDYEQISLEKSARHGDLKADLDVDSLNLVDATQLYDLDAIYIIREYDIYEKELRAGELSQVGTEDELKVLVAVG